MATEGQATSAERLAPAKINLYLDVLSKRGDGYHALETLFLALTWGDDVRVALGGDGPPVALSMHGVGDVPADETNLAWRAAAAFRAAAGDVPPIRIAVTKRIPPGAGLGGGSSDAATVLAILDSLLPGRVAPEALGGIAADLGADVPFFLHGGLAVGRGRGDELEPLAPPPSLAFVLILPPFGCNTASVFGAFERLRPAPTDGMTAMVEAVRAGEPARVRAAHHNALAFAAMKTHPALLRFTSDVERRLGRAPAMSGSGSALFDVPDEGELESVQERLAGLPGTLVVTHA